MKTKLTLFVTVLAVALFGMGCASVPKPDVTHAVKWNGHWYAYFTEEVTIKEARMQCKKLNGHLVIIETEDENKFIYEMMYSRDPERGNSWLGANRDSSAPSKTWVWENGLRISELYQGFRGGNTAFDLDRPGLWIHGPTGSNEGGASAQYHKHQDGWWYGALLNDRRPFICEWE